MQKIPPLPLLPLGPLAHPAGTWGVAVSGGADSTALLHLLLAAGVPPQRLHVLHVNHGWQSPSTQWQQQVHSLADSLGLACTSTTLTVPPPRTNAEAHARTHRWAWLTQQATTLGLAGILTGHSRTDEVEQLLMRLGRGSSLRGLTGMAPTSTMHGTPIARPMLQLERQQIRHYLTTLSQTWIEDPTNATSLRGRLRIIIPSLEKAGLPQHAFAASISALQRAENLIQSLVPTPPITLSAYRQLHPEVALRYLAACMPSTGPAVRTSKRSHLHTIVSTTATGTTTLGGYQWRWNETTDSLTATPQNQRT